MYGTHQMSYSLHIRSRNNNSDFIMTSNKVVVWTIFTCVILFGMIQSAHSDIITINQLRGSWYGIGETSLPSNTSAHIACHRIQVTREKSGVHDFRQIITFTQDGVAKRSEGYAYIRNSQIRITYPFSEHGSNFTAKIFRNGTEMILTDNNPPSFHRLMSRNLTCSTQTISAFENLASQHKATIQYFQHDNCSYKSISKPITP